MNQPRVLEGAYAADSGRRVVEYRTLCEYCPNLKACKKRRAHVPGCPPENIGWIQFAVDGVGKVGWSGVITLRKINSVVEQYLECNWDDVPSDVAMPERQLGLEELVA